VLRVGVRLTIVAAIVAAPRVAFAVAPTRLVYVRGPGAEACGDETVLRAAVASRVGADPFVLTAPLTIKVEVAASEGRLHGRVTLLQDGVDRGSQDIAGRGPAGTSCEDLLSSIALAVSVALDAEQALPQPPVDLPAIPPPPLPPLLPFPSPPIAPPQLEPPFAPVPERAPIRPWALWAAAGARASYGEWATPAFGSDLVVELRYLRYGLAVEGRYDVWTPVSVGGDGASASVQRGTASLVPCAHFGWFVACGVASVGETRATGDQVTSPLGGATATAPYAAFGARVGADLALLSRLHLLGTLDGVGIATPTNIAVQRFGLSGVDVAGSRPVEVSVGISALASIF